MDIQVRKITATNDGRSYSVNIPKALAKKYGFNKRGAHASFEDLGIDKGILIKRVVHH